MKQKLFFVAILLFASMTTFGQIVISENFDASTVLPAGWSSNGYTGTSDVACSGNSFRDNLFGSSTTGSLTTYNVVGASNGENLSLSFDYKVVDFGVPPVTGSSPGWGELIVQYSTNDGTDWINIMTINDGNHVTSGDCAEMTATINGADLPDGSDFKLQFVGNRTTGDFFIYLDDIVAEQPIVDPPLCTILSAPLNGATDTGIDGVISWDAPAGAPTNYILTVGTTPGGTDILNNFDVGNVTTYNLGTLSYETTYYVTITPVNGIGAATGCTEESFTTIVDPNAPVEVDCTAGTLNNTYCYTNNDTTRFDYISSDGSPLRVTFNAGGIETCCDDLIILDSDGTTELYNGTGTGGDLTGLTFQSSGDRITVSVDSDSSVDGCSGGRAEWDWDVACATCTNPTATYETREADCSEGNLFYVDIDITSLGDAGSLTISDDQPVPNTDTATAPGVVTLGPYPIGTNVIVSVLNDDDANCEISSGTLTVDASSCPFIIDCSAGALNQTYCYTNNDTTAFIYQSNDGSPLNVVFNSGGIETCCDDLIILDSDGTEIYNGVGDGGDLSGLIFQSSGDTITVMVDSDSSVAGCSGTRAEWNWDVSCATCIFQTVEYELREDDCENGEQFFVDVNITDIGDAATINVDDNQGSETQTANTTGIVTMGPYAIGTEVIITTENADDDFCNTTSDILTIDLTSCPTIVECAEGPANFSFCYTDDDNSRFYYESDDGTTTLRLVFNEGLVQDGFDEVIVYDSDGTTELYNGYGTAGDLSGLQFESSGSSISWQIQSNGFTSCESNGFTPINVDVFCMTCEMQTVEYNIVGECEEEQQFTIDVDITDMGSATSITVTDDQGSEEQVTTTTGIVTMGPYETSTNVIISVSNTDDPNCVTNSNLLTFVCPPPPNECSIVYAGADIELGCDDTETTLTANFMASGVDVDEYVINGLDACPTPPLSGGPSTGIDADDFWSPAIDLTFEFCFFGNTYDQVVIDANGAITFDVSQALQPSGWIIGAGDLLPTTNMHLNAIFGAYHDMNIADVDNEGTIEYFILGSAPARQFVINYNNIQHFGTSCRGFTTTQQIILYESSNVIDINIFDKPACTGWNGGRAIIGIQNDSGTIAFTPPGRNTGVWDVENEFWRFAPAGDAAYSFEWFEGTTSLGTDETITVSPTVETTYTAQVTYTLCDGTTATVTDDVTVGPTVEPVDILNDVDVCDEYILPVLNSGDYYTESGGNGTMLNAGDTITSSQTLYIYAEDPSDPTCFDESSFTITVLISPTANSIANIESCENTVTGLALFDTSLVESTIVGSQTGLTVTYTDADGNTLPSPLPNPYETSEQTITVTLTNSNGCETTTSFSLVFQDPSTCELFIPEGFSPNGDGINDTFEIINLSSQFPNYSIEIFNRWGKRVFKGNSNTGDWNGKLDGTGELVSVGVYYFILDFNDPDEEPIQDRLYISR